MVQVDDATGSMNNCEVEVEIFVFRKLADIIPSCIGQRNSVKACMQHTHQGLYRNLLATQTQTSTNCIKLLTEESRQQLV